MKAAPVRRDQMALRPCLTCAVLVCAAVLAPSARAGELRDAALTPGVADPAVTQWNLQATVCMAGYSKSVRPAAQFTNALKWRQIVEYGYADRDPRDYEEDHLIPLALGGAARDERNLWPQRRDGDWGAARKDELEEVLYRMVCAGELPLATAQRAIATNWIEAWKHYVPGRPHYRRYSHE